jgi:hypothetical protein
MENKIDFDKISRVEIINHATNNGHRFGRLLSLHQDINFKSLEISIQDGGRTMKIFLDGDMQPDEVS